MEKTLNHLPTGSFLRRSIGKFVLFLFGWKLDGHLPDVPKMVLFYYPHTTGWDFVHIMAGMFAYGVKPNWMGKKELFVWPAGVFFRALGGIATDRSKTKNTVDAIAESIKAEDKVLVGIAPEGTRKHAPYIKSGFYHIAMAAKVPVVFGYLDYPSKTVGFGPGFTPSGDIETDLGIARAFFADKRGKYPHEHGTIAFRPKDN